MKPVPFNSLGQIKSSGGELAIGIGLATGWTPEQAKSWLASHYTGIPDSFAEAIIASANEGVAAARHLTANATDSLGSGVYGIDLSELGDLYDKETGRIDLTQTDGTQLAPELAGLLLEQINLGMIPIVPELYGDEPEGRRIQLSAQIGGGAGESRIRLDMDFEAEATWADIVEVAMNRINTIVSEYPERFADLDVQEMLYAGLKIIFAERKY